ncbi:S-formylglutathione hydrolase [Carnimonas nigrificans]|uniref:S-formylglutathione hydrolase n=1 Tax=Carnimonas nigrificans TaxID=64323 RepID=UPI000552374E|nr:S-formylglutathione hydrolase [Carnimonas nigrificans]
MSNAQPSHLELVSSHLSFGGLYQRYRHSSQVLDCEMTFGIFLPDQRQHPQPNLLWWLSGLTCTDENFMQKAGAHRLASELGLAIVCPDTSPRGTDLPHEHESYDLGSGAGFYLNATRAPWNQHYRMYDYVVDELPRVVRDNFSLGEGESICGHSMGGHGALVLALRNPDRYASVSAFAPIVNPSQVPWGEKAFSHYLGEHRDEWQQYDAVALLASHAPGRTVPPMLVDQGEADSFIEEGQLMPQRLEEACQKQGVACELRMQPGYDHSYFFIASFIEDHLRFHARHLGQR